MLLLCRLLIMSVQVRIADPSKDRPSGSKNKVKMPPPPTGSMVSPSQVRTQPMPYEPNVATMPDYGVSQVNARPQVNMPIQAPGPQRYQQPSPRQVPGLRSSVAPSAYPGFMPSAVQPSSSHALENELRNMILSHDPPPGHHRTTSTHVSGHDLSSQVQPAPQGNRRRPNQAQRKQQAQQMQLPLQHTQAAANLANLHFSRHSQSYGPSPSNDCFDVHQQRPPYPQSNVNQRQPYGAVPQPRSLFDPGSRADPGHGRDNRIQSQAVNNQVQIDYIDRLARAKIPEVQMSTEEYAEKQLLKGRLNDICRKVVLSHELKSNPEFRQESVELKSFGSLSIGFATKDSDMDLVLVSPESKPDLSSPESEIPRMVEKCLMDLGYGARLLTKTRVPIIKFCEKPGPELAANLRLARLWWEKEQDTHVRPASTELSANALEAAPENFEDTMSLDQEVNLEDGGTSPLIRNPLNIDGLVMDHLKVQRISATDDETAKIESHVEIENVLTPAGGKESKKPPQGKPQNDPAWLPKLSDHELVGLFRTALKEGHCAPHQRVIISECLESLVRQIAPEGPEGVRKRRETLQNLSDVIKKCRVPGREDLEFPKSGVGTQCDINFSNQLALHNSLLLKCYSLCDPRVREMVLFVKAWTKKRKINSPYHGTLNSYGYVLMVLHFLMNVAQPPVIPNLQLATDMIQRDPLSSTEVSFDGHNVQFFRNEAAIEEMAQNGVFGDNRESLGSLLRRFFHFYANPPFGTFSWKDDVLSLRTRGGILTKAGKGWVGARTEMVDLAGPGSDHKKVSHRYVVAIEDPFETGHNVARTVFFKGVVAIRDEFRRAADLISHASVDPRLGPQDFFAEGKKNENLQQRHRAHHKDAMHKKDILSTTRSTPANTSAPKKDTKMQETRAARVD